MSRVASFPRKNPPSQRFHPVYLLSVYVPKRRTKWRELLTRGSTVSHKRLTERWAGNKMKFSIWSGRQKLATSVHDAPATSNNAFLVLLASSTVKPISFSFSFSLEPPTTSTYLSLFTTASNLWSSLDSSTEMEAKPKCVSKFGYVYTKEEKKIDEKEKERRKKNTTYGFHLLYTWKILLGRIQPLRMIRQLLPRWNRFAWIVQIVFPWFSSTRVNGEPGSRSTS